MPGRKKSHLKSAARFDHCIFVRSLAKANCLLFNDGWGRKQIPRNCSPQSSAVRLLSQRQHARLKSSGVIGACLASARVNAVAAWIAKHWRRRSISTVHASTMLHEVNYERKNSPAFLHAAAAGLIRAVEKGCKNHRFLGILQKKLKTWQFQIWGFFSFFEKKNL